jgi:uncharacterized protein YndB with AHSA1/START domain
MFELTIEIAAPPARVWEVMTDIDRWHEWTPSITSIARLDNAAFAVGTRIRTRQPKLPAALWKITAIDPGKSFTWTSTAPGLKVDATHQVEPAEGGSLVTLSIDYSGMFGGMWERLTRDITKRYVGFEANGLKARSENPGYVIPR